MPRHDLIIVGAGPVGMTLALALKDAGLDILLVDARARGAARHDPRVLALSHGSRLTLERLGIWQQLPATPIETIHISQQGRLGRSLLTAADYGLPAMGYVVAAGHLAAALDDALAAAGIPVQGDSPVRSLAAGADSVTLSLADGTLEARLVACAEGSIQGNEAPELVERDYAQHAVISVATPVEGHAHRAWERFTPQGPLAVLPCGADCAIVHTASPAEADALMALDDEAYRARLQAHFGERLHFASVGPRAVLPCGADCAIVHTASPAEADALMALDDDAYRARLQAHFGERLHFAAVGPRARYPLLLRYRPDPVGPRTVWLGNAAQTLHPVAGQGYNLALRDVWALAQVLLKAGGDPGDPATLARYADARRLDRQGTIRFTDGLVRLFSNAIPPLAHARGAGLFALDLLPPARHFVAKRMMFGARAWP